MKTDEKEGELCEGVHTFIFPASFGHLTTEMALGIVGQGYTLEPLDYWRIRPDGNYQAKLRITHKKP